MSPPALLADKVIDRHQTLGIVGTSMIRGVRGLGGRVTFIFGLRGLGLFGSFGVVGAIAITVLP